VTPEEAADHLEITRVWNLYFRAMDTGDYALLDQVFLPGAALRYAALAGADTTYPEMVDAFRRFNLRFRFSQHLGAQLLIDLRGDEATATSTLRAIHVREEGGLTRTFTVYGAYRDHFVRTREGWRIRERRFEARHTEGKP
jgi:hypothetical protein